MTTLLALTSSALGEASVSNGLIAGILAKLRVQQPELRIITRDLGHAHVPHLTLDSATALRGAPPANAAQEATLALSNDLLEELRAADILLIGAPMYNFAITSTLKTWFDHVLRAGLTFRYTEAGPVGLMTGKRAIVVETRGGFYSSGPAQAMDAQEPHLRGLLGFIGITDVTFVRAEKLAFGPEPREAAIAQARAELDAVMLEPVDAA